MNPWRAALEAQYPLVIAAGGLSHRAAIATAALLRSGAYRGAQLVECRRSAGAALGEALWLDVDVAIGQLEAVNNIRATEPVAVIFYDGGTPPAAYPLREDFPERVPHLNMSPPGFPRSLCLYEMPVEDVLRIATPHAVIERIRWWLAETAHGKLHGDDQPLDPLFCPIGETVILPDEDIVALAEHDLAFVQGPGGPAAPFHLVRVKDLQGGSAAQKATERYATMVVLTDAVPHVGINMPPATLADLIAIYADLGVDVVGPLRAAFRRWTGRQDLADFLERPWLLLLVTPIQRSPGVPGALMTRGFQTGNVSSAAAARALGALLFHGNLVSRPITEMPPEEGAGADVALMTLDLQFPMSRRLARLASGRIDRDGDDREIALVGAGALGSQLAMTAARMGIGTWSIIDHDFLLPHNLARHALLRRHVGISKAMALACELDAMLGPRSVKVLCDLAIAREAEPLLAAADLVLDVSASVPTARILALRSRHATRTMSVFLNPAGTDLVILCEGAERTPRIDHVEMAYHWLLVVEGLDDHHASNLGGIRPSGGCRVPSLQIPQSRIGALASFAVERIFRPLPNGGFIEILHLDDEGLSITKGVAPLFREVTVAEFTVSISTQVCEHVFSRREKAGGDETGGILIGSWDRARNVLYVVAATDAPTDSVGTPTGFERGAAGVFRTLDDIETVTAGNLTYVGEWHSHPPGAGTRPSGDDRVLLRWIAKNLEFCDVPPCMIIAGDNELRVIVRTHKESAVLKRENG